MPLASFQAIKDRGEGDILAAAKNAKFSMEFACAASFRFSLSRVRREILPDCTAASPYLARSSRGAELWSIPLRTLASRGLRRK